MSFLYQLASAPIMLKIYLGNDVYHWILSSLIFLASIVAFYFLKTVVINSVKKLSEKTSNDIDDLLVTLLHKIKPFSYLVVSVYIASLVLQLPVLIRNIVFYITLLVIVWQIVTLLIIVSEYILNKAFKGDEKSGAVSTLRFVIKLSIWSIALLFILSNFGIDVTSLIAGLGIGGLAIALALQTILSDLFSSFAILLDKPFVVGDFIVVGEDMGTVEKIGIKTTRIRALQGEEIVISNQELTSARIQNFHRMEKRRVAFEIGVIYETSNEKLAKVPELIKKAIENIDSVTFDRSHMVRFDASAITFESVFFVKSPEYKDFLDAQQEILLKIKEYFGYEGIKMAYPTQTVYLKNE